MDKFFQTLKIVIENLEGKDFVVTGTYNLYLQGINIDPGDMDLLTDDSVVFEAGRKFESVLKMNEHGFIETEFFLNGVGVHLVSTRNNVMRPPFRENTTWIEKEGLEIPCLSLKSELDFYTQIQREKDKGKAELIRERTRS